MTCILNIGYHQVALDIFIHFAYRLCVTTKWLWLPGVVPRLILVLAITALLISFLAEDRVTGNCNSHIGANI